MIGTALETIEKLNEPFDLKWHPGNPGFWEAVMGEEEKQVRKRSCANWTWPIPHTFVFKVKQRHYYLIFEKEQ